MTENPTRTALVVDDEEALRESLVKSFERKGFRVLQAENGKRALEIFNANPIDVIISDIRMPGGSGVDFVREVSQTGRETPVILFMTGYADLTLDEAYHIGATSLLTKPFTREMLHERVTRYLVPAKERWEKSEAMKSEPLIEKKLSITKDLGTDGFFTLGHGGFFLQETEPKLRQDSKTAFNLKVTTPSGPHTLIGEGVIRWVRKEKTGDLQPGYGIEILWLTEPGRKSAIQYIQTLRAKSFIPKN